MITLIPTLLMFPLLVGQLIIVVFLFKFWRQSFWWLMLGGCLCNLVAFYLQASSLSLNPLDRYRLPLIYPVFIDVRSISVALAGLFLSTLGLALCGAFLYKLKNRIEQLDQMMLARSREFEKYTSESGNGGRLALTGQAECSS